MSEAILENFETLVPPVRMREQLAVASFNMRYGFLLLTSCKLLVDSRYDQPRLYLPHYNRHTRVVVLGHANREALLAQVIDCFQAQGGRLPAIAATPLATASPMESLAT